jgi:hypothetical protein
MDFQIGSAKDIKQQIAEFRAQGMQVTPEMVVVLAEQEEREADNIRFKAERVQAAAALKALEEDARRTSAKAALKGRMRQAYMMQPGVTEEDFERDYPGLEKDHIKNSTLERMANGETAQTELARRKRQTGDYAL